MDKGVLIIGAVTLAALAVIMVTAKNNPEQNRTTSFEGEDSNIISESGVHWHPELAIYIKGQKQAIPTNIGVGPQYANRSFYNARMGMTDIHTHSADGILHWEIAKGPVKRGQAKLGAFFEVWGKIFNKEQIFDAKDGEGGTVKMTVNSQPSLDFENYIVKDKDKIEIRFE